MKRILTIVIFLLTLHPVLNIGNDTAVQAQNFAYENGSNWLPWMEVTGKDKSGQVKCDACGGSFEDDEAFNNHLKYSYACAVFYNRCDVCGNPEDQCTCKKETCEVCGQPKDLCLCGAICCFCKKPIGKCTCSGVIVPGNRGSNSGDGSSWGFDCVDPDVDVDVDIDGGYHSNDLSPGKGSSDNHTCSCLVTSTRKAAVADVTAKKISAVNKRTSFTASSLASSVQKTIEFPETINQGKYGTCGAAIVEKELATYHPYQFKECIESLISTGRYDKWGLTLPPESGIKNMTESQARQKGLSLTDVIFQTAFATWANNNDPTEKTINAARKIIGGKDGVFRPLEASGKDGNVSPEDIDIFLHDKLGINKSNAEVGKSDCFNRYSSDYDFSSNTYLATVCVKYDSKGQLEFPNEKSDHWVEITGIDKDGVHIWTWGKEYIVPRVYADKIVRRSKTPALKKDETERKKLSCVCKKCSEGGCTDCKN